MGRQLPFWGPTGGYGRVRVGTGVRPYTLYAFFGLCTPVIGFGTGGLGTGWFGLARISGSLLAWLALGHSSYDCLAPDTLSELRGQHCPPLLAGDAQPLRSSHIPNSLNQLRVKPQIIHSHRSECIQDVHAIRGLRSLHRPPDFLRDREAEGKTVSQAAGGGDFVRG